MMSFIRNLLRCSISSLVVIPLIAAAQQPVAPWPTFQVDDQLVLQLPALPRQVTNKEGSQQQEQSYVAQNPQGLWLLLRQELPTTGPLPNLSSFYTGLAQTTLTHWKAVGVRQTSFRVGEQEGFVMDFRIVEPAPGIPANGTIWMLQSKQALYVAQYFPQHPDSPENIVQKQRFLASWKLAQLPIGKIDSADFVRFRVGQFHDLNPALPTTTLIRTDTAQTEVNPGLNLRIVYSVRWTKTGYDLRQRSSNASYAAVMKPKIIHVRITAVQGDTYWYRAVTDDFIATGQIQRVK